MLIEQEQFNKVFNAVETIENEVSKNIIGQKEVVRQVLVCILAGGNVLLEGVPGLGKTRLVNTLGKIMGLDFSRIQFTPDLMPADISGTNIISKADNNEGQFIFQKGPIFSNIVLADEINRATPKTQSALLEAMQEHTVTVGNATYPLPQPFFVLATQNPIEMEGTYPLPEAQLDRFIYKLKVPYPSLDELMQIVTLTTQGNEPPLTRVTSGEEILEYRKIVTKIAIAKPVLEYALKLVLFTHPEIEQSPEISKKYLRFGSSPRGAQAIISTAKVFACLDKRYNVSFNDIKKAAYPSLRHRIFLNFDAVTEGMTQEKIIDEIISILDK